MGIKSSCLSGLAFEAAYELNGVACLHHLLRQLVLVTLGRPADRMVMFSNAMFRCCVLPGIAAIAGLVFDRSVLNKPVSTLPMEKQIARDTSQKLSRNLYEKSHGTQGTTVFAVMIV